jgi:L-aminopeptidase/D-esterase-like protein
VVINEKLAPRHLKQIGKQVQHALSQVIYPYATILDGDVLYTVSTRSVESDLYAPGADIETDLNAKFIYLGMVAGELAKQAVWNAVGYNPLPT